jgi:mannose-6-phosphate isomerase-like protein (cupin superfamily)
MWIGARTLASPVIPRQAMGALVRVLARALRTVPTEEPEARSMTAGVAARLRALPRPDPSAFAAHLPVLVHLPAALAAGGSLGRALGHVLPYLPWRRTYAGMPGLEGFLRGYGYAELVGPGGPVRTEDLRLGVLLLGPGTLYPLHRHPAEEIYLVVSGAADWRRGGGHFRPRPAGSLVYHPPGEPHAMRTAGEPMLAVYAWTGDVATPARLIPEDEASPAGPISR